MVCEAAAAASDWPDIDSILFQRDGNSVSRRAGRRAIAWWTGVLSRLRAVSVAAGYVIEHTVPNRDYPNDIGEGFFALPGENALVIINGATGLVMAREPLARNTI
jgi:hypothetical protein